MKIAHSIRAIGIATIINSILFTPSLVAAREFPALENHKFTVTMKNAKIVDYIASVSKSLGINFVVDPRVDGRVTVSSQGSLNVDEYYALFLSTLQHNGYVVFESKGDPRISLTEMTLTMPITAGEFRELAIRKPTLLGKVLSVESHVVDGKLIGYRVVSNGNNPGALEAYGIFHGDVIIKVNDRMLDSQKQGIRAMRDAVRADKLEILLLRDNREIPITISLAR